MFVPSALVSFLSCIPIKDATECFNVLGTIQCLYNEEYTGFMCHSQIIIAFNGQLGHV